MKAAIISYNSFLPGKENGWIETEMANIFLLQNESQHVWGVQQMALVTSGTKVGEECCKKISSSLFERLASDINDFDFVVIYVGSSGAENLISLASSAGLSHEKVVFVLCDCGIGLKKRIIGEKGYTNSKLIDCEC